MKTISGTNPVPQWSSNLLQDLAFIKKKLRYPISKKTLPSAFMILIFGAAIGRFLLPVVLTKGENTLVSIIFLAFIVLFVVFAFYQYLRTLRFAVIPTTLYADENRKLVEQFLKSQQLAVYSHPQAPEVFQIVSTPIGDPKNDYREVMIFIADDKRILINSHFTNQRFALAFSSGNYKQMANNLRNWAQRTQPGTLVRQ